MVSATCSLPSGRRTRGVAAMLLASFVAALAAAPAAADDRRLFQESTAEPFVFVLLDLSGSMNQSVPCTAEGIAAGHCAGVRADVLHAAVPCGKADLEAGRTCVPCPEGDCLPRQAADDPESKMRVAKEALYALMDEVDDIHFGFATFNHNELRVAVKHWWYRLADEQPNGHVALRSGRLFPAPGQEEVFGDSWRCDLAGGPGGDHPTLRWVGCRSQDPADLDDRWDYERVRRLPKLDDDNERTVQVYVRDPADGRVYQVQYQPEPTVSDGPGPPRFQVLGDDRLWVRVRVQCLGSCSPFNTVSRLLLFEKVDDFVGWEPTQGVRKDPPGVAFFGAGDFPNGPRTIAGPAPSGWEPNTDSGVDDYRGQTLKQPTIDDPRGNPLDVGDVIPWDWQTDQRELIKRRLAPNTGLPGFDPASGAPDFEIASYFADHPNANGYLPLADSRAKPLLAHSNTPTGNSMEDFADWLDDWEREARDPDTGDESRDCRRQFLLVITDGLASDGDRACDAAAELLEDDVRTFAIALGLSETEFSGFDNTLTCIANQGGTGTRTVGGVPVREGPGPLFPQNKQQLVDALLQVIQIVRSDPRTLTGVAVPSVQADAADKLYLTDFTPLNRQPVWAGKVHAFVKPLPLDADGQPDLERRCADLPADAPRSGCYLGDLAQTVLTEQVRPSRLDPVGNGAAQRRIYYAGFDDLGRVPRARRFFLPIEDTTPLDVSVDLLAGFGLDPTAGDSGDRANQAIVGLLAEKSAVLPDGGTLSYVVGDVFHSDPLVVGSPSNNLYFLADVGGDGAEGCAADDRGYRCFALEHARRRRMLFAGANDGMLHAFDIGRWIVDPARLPLGGSFDDGSGRELFAYSPRPVLPTVLEMIEQNAHHYTVDGQVVAADVFVDPVHSARIGDPVDPDERRWRTVLLGGLGRGGGVSGDLEMPLRPDPLPADPDLRTLLEEQPTSGYYALDVTQPDPVDPDTRVPAVPAGAQPGCAGDAGGGGLPDDCGEVAFGMPLWEFRDSRAGIAADEDGDGWVDLAPTWSTPDLGRIRVCTADCGTVDAVFEDRHVAVFGGGLDPDRPARGQWLYVVDVETGEAIAKHPLDGAVPSRPAAVDTDRDGYLDRVYVGTTEGLLYRMDLVVGVGGSKLFPVLAPADPPLVYTGRDVDSDGEPLVEVTHAAPRLQGARFAPFVLFDAGADDGAARPIFYRPSVFYVPQLSRYAVAFGTGDREDIFARGAASGRFFVLVDEVDDPALLAAPLVPGDLVEIERDAPFTPGATTAHLLEGVAGRRGWWLELDADERLITAPFVLTGVVVFSTYQPQGPEPVAGNLCREIGRSRIYGVLATSGDGIMVVGAERRRYMTVDDFVTAPFTEQSQTKNPPPVGGEGDGNADQLDAALAQILRELQALFPRSCRFSESYRIDIKARSSDTGMIFVAPVPICVIEKDFREY